MKTNHTPGEWYINTENRNDMTVRNGKKGFVIAEVTKKGLTHFIGNEAEAEANLKLIAAAPDLLEVALKIKEDIEIGKIHANSVIVKDSYVWYKLVNAINKATQ